MRREAGWIWREQGGRTLKHEFTFGKVRVTAGAALTAAILCYLGQENLLLLFGLSGMLHELGHWFAAWLCGVPVEGLRISVSGGAMQLGRRCAPAQEALILAAGPVINLLEAGLCARLGLELAAGAALLLGLLNLLPAGPLDGGQLVRLLFSGIFGPGLGETIARAVSLLTEAGLLLTGGALFFGAKGTPALLFFALWLLIFTIYSLFPLPFPHATGKIEKIKKDTM